MRKILFGIAALMGAGAAHASIIPTLSADPTDVGGGIFSYVYEATLASDQAAFDGSFFTLYDVVGFTGFGALPANWDATSALLGNTPDNVIADDDATITNVTFTYRGPTLNFTDPGVEIELGLFEIFSTVGTFGFDDFTSSAIRNSGPSAGTTVSTIGEDAIAVPGAGNPLPIVPEPATWGMMIAGFAMTGAVMRRRKSIIVSA